MTGLVHLAGDGICAEIAPRVFTMHDDGLAYVKEDKAYFSTTLDYDADGTPHFQMAHGLARVPESLIDDVIEAAEACPGECIMLQMEDDIL